MKRVTMKRSRISDRGEADAQNSGRCLLSSGETDHKYNESAPYRVTKLYQLHARVYLYISIYIAHILYTRAHNDKTQRISTLFLFLATVQALLLRPRSPLLPLLLHLPPRSSQSFCNSSLAGRQGSRERP